MVDLIDHAAVMTMLGAESDSYRAHPFVFFLLILPFGVMAGYLTVAVAYQLAKAGVSVEDIGALMAISVLPHICKFLWAPIVDTSFSRNTWYLIGSVASAVGIAAIGAIPKTTTFMSILSLIVLVANIAVTLLGMAVQSMMSHCTLVDEKGCAAGWFQAGNLSGSGLGGGAGLWIVEQASQSWEPGMVLAAICLSCSIGLSFFVVEPSVNKRADEMQRGIAQVAQEVLLVTRSRSGYLGLLILALPIGSGAASNLWSPMAADWDISANAVASVNGLLRGVISALGCIVGGHLCDRLNRKVAYLVFGVLMAVCAATMAIAPRRQETYIVFVMLYAFIAGLTYAGFSAVVLEIIGTGAAATKYSLFASLASVPVAYMTLINGWSYALWGANVMLLIEAVFGLVGVLIYLGLATLSGRRWRN